MLTRCKNDTVVLRLLKVKLTHFMIKTVVSVGGRMRESITLRTAVTPK